MERTIFKPTRIVEIVLHRSKRYPKYAHAVAKLLPCDHNKYLGICRFPKEYDEKPNIKIVRVEGVRVWFPQDYGVAERETCIPCAQNDLWIADLPHLSEIVDNESGLDTLD